MNGGGRNAALGCAARRQRQHKCATFAAGERSTRGPEVGCWRSHLLRRQVRSGRGREGGAFRRRLRAGFNWEWQKCCDCRRPVGEHLHRACPVPLLLLLAAFPTAWLLPGMKQCSMQRCMHGSQTAVFTQRALRRRNLRAAAVAKGDGARVIRGKCYVTKDVSPKTPLPYAAPQFDVMACQMSSWVHIM